MFFRVGSVSYTHLNKQYGGARQYIPLKVNAAGVMPIIFAQAIMSVSYTHLIEYDPNRSARIALLYYADGEKRYIIAPNGLQVGATLMSGENAAPEIGNALPLQNIPVGTVIHNIELRPGQGAALVRSAGNFAQLTSREGKYCVIKLPSGEVRQILNTCKATVGSVGNSDHGLESSGKAGRSRWQGRRPRNRGVVMNPVDHPMGGGEGRASGGHPRSRKGLYAKGLKTRAPKKQSSKYIIERRKK